MPKQARTGMAWGALAPLLAGLYFVLELAAANADESLHPGDLVPPLLASVGFAGLAFLLSRAWARGNAAGSLLGTAVVVGFSTFGYGVAVMEDLWALDRVTWAPPLLLAMVAALLGLAFALRWTARSCAGAANYVTLLFGLLVGFAAGRLAYGAVSGAHDAMPATTIADAVSAPSRRLPDIYLIVPDKYTGSRYLASEYGFDNRPFESFLEGRGFIVPREARANYVHTFLALAAMLNVRYLEDLPASLGPDATSRRAVDRLVEDNAVVRLLRDRGYRIVFTPTAYPTTRRNRMADLQIPAPGKVRPEFVTAWLWTTPVPVLEEQVCLLLHCTLERSTTPPERAELIDWKFSELERLAGDERPTFTFVHLTVPHEPYLYHGDCRHRRPYWPWPDTLEAARRAYVEQVQCVNRKLERLVTAIQERSRVPPVILIQSDHGHARLGRRVPPAGFVPSEQQAERASVFAAYLLPDLSRGDIPDGITPVNVMRLVLRKYLGAQLAPLKDVTYWSSTESPYRFVPVTTSD